MDSFKIESTNKIIEINGHNVVFDFDNNEFTKKLINLSEFSKDDKNGIEMIDELSKYIDDLFGKDTCKSIFGVDKPSYYLIYKFIEVITPIIEEFANKRDEFINNKYDVGREADV